MPLDKSQFLETMALVALHIHKKQTGPLLKKLAGHIFHRARVKPVVPDEANPDLRLLLLSEAVTDVGLQGLPAELREHVLSEGATAVPYSLDLGYEHLSVEQCLRRLLPEGIDEIPSSFEQVGHVAHVNLRAEHLPYKTLIGEVLLDKNTPRIRSVVNKVESISSHADEKAWRFRVFPMEVIAGEDNLRTSVRENGARFELDYRDVYWNSRLEHEHRRILELLPADCVVADAFAGIGPFAVPLAMKGCAVYANDLNPHSHQWLCTNVAGNRVGDRCKTYNLDGKSFIHHLLGHVPPNIGSVSAGGAAGGGHGAAHTATGSRAAGSTSDGDVAAAAAAAAAPQGSALALDLRNIAGSAKAAPKAYEPALPLPAEQTSATAAAAGASSATPASSSLSRMPFGCFSHVLMNLPASALTFLDSFVGAFDRATWKAPLPTVHCYCFSKAESPDAGSKEAACKAEVIAIAEKAMGCALPDASVTVVRDVSPHKLMLCLTFQVPEAVAWRSDADPTQCPSVADSASGAGLDRTKRPRTSE